MCSSDLGAMASIWLARALVAVPLPFPVPFEAEVPLDLHLLAYLATLVGLATLVVGIAPVLQAFRVSVVGGTGSAPRAVGHRRWSARGEAQDQSGDGGYRANHRFMIAFGSTSTNALAEIGRASCRERVSPYV